MRQLALAVFSIYLLVRIRLLRVWAISMVGMKRLQSGAGGAGAALYLVLLVLGLNACTSTSSLNNPPGQAAALPPVPPPPVLTPPPVDLAGKWRLSVAGSSACTMTFGGSTGASDGSIAPAGGCPLNFFTSRKWSYENDKLVIRNHKSDVLVQLSFANGHFEGQTAGGGAVTLAR